MAKKTLITAKEAAKEIGITDRAVRGLVERGRIAAEEERGANGALLFSKAEIKRYLSERKKAEKEAEKKRKAKEKEKAKKAKAKKPATKGGK